MTVRCALRRPAAPRGLDGQQQVGTAQNADHCRVAVTFLPSDGGRQPLPRPRVFAYGDFIIGNKKNRCHNLKAYPKYHGKGNTFMYEVTDEMVASFSTRPQKSKDKAEAAARLERLVRAGRSEPACSELFRLWSEAAAPSLSNVDVVRDAMSKLTDEEKNQVRSDVCHALGLQPDAVVVDVHLRKAIDRNRIRIRNFLEIVNESPTFGPTAGEASALHDARGSNTKFKTGAQLIPPRKKIEPDVLHVVGPRTLFLDVLESRDEKTRAQMARIGHVHRAISTEERFLQATRDVRERLGSEEHADLLGVAPAEFHKLSEKEVGMDALTFLRTGFYAVAVHLTRSPAQPVREAVMTSKHSVFAAVERHVNSQHMSFADKANLLQELQHLKTVWRPLFDLAPDIFAIAQERVHKTLPQTATLWETACEVDAFVKERFPGGWKQSPSLLGVGHCQVLCARAFLGLGLTSGYRSGQMAQLRTSAYVPTAFSHYQALKRLETGSLVLVTTENKRAKLTGRPESFTVPLTKGVSDWVDEYEKHGREKLLFGRPDHGYLFSSPTGLALKKSEIRDGNEGAASAGSATKHKLENGPMLALLHNVCGAVLGDDKRLGMMTCYTDFRAVTLASDTSRGSMLHLLQEGAAFAGEEVDPDLNSSSWLPDKEALVELHKSSIEQSTKCYLARKVNQIARIQDRFGDVLACVRDRVRKRRSPETKVNLRHKIVGTEWSKAVFASSTKKINT